MFRLLCYFGDKIAAVAENENLSKKLGKIEITKEQKVVHWNTQSPGIFSDGIYYDSESSGIVGCVLPTW